MKAKGTSKIEQVAQAQGYAPEADTDAKTHEATPPQGVMPQIKAESGARIAAEPQIKAEAEEEPKTSAKEKAKLPEPVKIALLEGYGRVVELTARRTISTGQYENLVMEAKYAVGEDDDQERLTGFFVAFRDAVDSAFGRKSGNQASINAQAPPSQAPPPSQAQSQNQMQNLSQSADLNWRSRKARPEGGRYPNDDGTPSTEAQNRLCYVLWDRMGRPAELKPENLTKVEAMKYIDTFGRRK